MRYADKLILFIISIFIIFACRKNNEFQKLYIENLKSNITVPNDLKIERLSKENALFKSYIASYYSQGNKIYALVNIPKTKMPLKGYPVVVVNHGRIEPSKYSTEYSYRLVSDHFVYNGFIVLKSDYRGHGNSDGTTDRQMGRFSYAIDVLDLMALLPSIKEADLNNVFMYGHSMGGIVTLTVLSAGMDVKAATLWSAVSKDFPENILYFRRRRSLTEADELLKEFKKTIGRKNFPKLSHSTYFKDFKTDIIIHHGTDDSSVPYVWSVDLNKELSENNVYNEFYAYEGDDHNFLRGSYYKVLDRDVEFFKKRIKD